MPSKKTSKLPAPPTTGKKKQFSLILTDDGVQFTCTHTFLRNMSLRMFGAAGTSMGLVKLFYGWH